jgi:hypothetical protein
MLFPLDALPAIFGAAFCDPILYDGSLIKSTAIKSIAMANITTARKLGILARFAAQRTGSSRTLSAVWKGGRALAAHWGGVIRQLWLEVTGFVFLALAALGALSLVREYARYHSGETNNSRVLVAIIFTLVFAWFGLSSFWRVRRKR